MKWFHHECTARHDPKIQALATVHGPAGVGIYWMLLEEIGQHSDAFCLEVSRRDELSGTVPAPPREPLSQASGTFDNDPHAYGDIPRVSLRTLARTFFTSPRKLEAVMQACVEVGLFDRRRWADLNVLYSPSFEQRADDYTRRVQRRTNNVRTPSAQIPESIRTLTGQAAGAHHLATELNTDLIRPKSDNLRPEQSRTEEKRTEQTCGQGELSTASQQAGAAREEIMLITKQIINMIVRWNASEQARLSWLPLHADVACLLHEAGPDKSPSLCREASSRLGRQVSPPQLLILAVMHMLEVSRKTRIVNPVGWLRACLTVEALSKTSWLDFFSSPKSRPPP